MTYIVTYYKRYQGGEPTTDFIDGSAMQAWMNEMNGQVVITLMKKIKSKHTRVRPQVPVADLAWKS